MPESFDQTSISRPVAPIQTYSSPCCIIVSFEFLVLPRPILLLMSQTEDNHWEAYWVCLDLIYQVQVITVAKHPNWALINNQLQLKWRFQQLQDSPGVDTSHICTFFYIDAVLCMPRRPVLVCKIWAISHSQGGPHHSLLILWPLIYGMVSTCMAVVDKRSVSPFQK